MKSRAEGFSRREENIINGKLNIIDFDTTLINNAKFKGKLDTSNFGKTLANDANFNKKLDASEFDTTLRNNDRFKGKFNTNDFDKTLRNNDDFKAKMNTSDFDTTLKNNNDFKAKLNSSEFASKLSDDPTITGIRRDLNSMPTNQNIQSLVNTEVQSKVGDINAANTRLTNSYTTYDTNLSTKYTEFSNNAGIKLNDYNANAVAKVGEYDANAVAKVGEYDANAGTQLATYNRNAGTQLTAYNNNHVSKIGDLQKLKDDSSAFATESRNSAVASADAKFETQKIYDDVFKEVSGRVVTQSNVYRDGLKFNSATGYYEPFGSIAGNVRGAVADRVAEAGGAANVGGAVVAGAGGAANVGGALANGVAGGAVTDRGTSSSSGAVSQVVDSQAGSSLLESSLGTSITPDPQQASETIFKKEQAVITALNGFNTKYYEWISCKNGKCPTGKTEADTRRDLESAAATLESSIEDLKNAYPASGETDSSSAIIQKAQEIDQLRRDLDTKMDSIIKSKMRKDEPSVTYDSTVYAGILWSVLGTSLLFYVFTE